MSDQPISLSRADRRKARHARSRPGGQAMKAYCLGYTHERCSTCQHEKNWQMLNQMPDVLRKSIQSQMRRVDDERCRLTKMGEYVACLEAKK